MGLLDAPGLSKKQADGFYTPAPSATAPSSPKAGQAWLSNAWADVRLSHALGDRVALLAPLTSPNETTIQEPATWFDGSYFNMMYNAGGGTGLCIRRCPATADPMVPANWTKLTGPGGIGQFIGTNAGGITSSASHQSVMIFGSTLYCYAAVGTASIATIDLWTAPLSDPTTWTRVGTVIPKTSLPSGATQWGNTYVVQDPGSSTYYMMLEYLDSAGYWQMTQATSSSLTGTFTLIPGLAPMTSVYLNASATSSGGGWLVYEAGQWVMYYHATDKSTGVVPTYRATAPSLGADNWTVQGAHDDRTNPYLRPMDRYEVDQACDPDLLIGPGGQKYLFWTGLDNRNATFRIYGAPLHPVRKVWDGYRWRTNEPGHDVARGIDLPGKPLSIVKTTDFSGTSTTFASMIGTGGWEPTGTDYTVELIAVVQASATGRYSFEAVYNSGEVTALMGAVDLTANTATAIHLIGKITQRRPGLARAVEVYYKVPSGATLYCRPVTQAGVEACTMLITDASYRHV